MKKGNRKAEIMLKSIEKIGKEINDKNDVVRTHEVTEKLRESKKKFSDILGASYDQAFDISK